MITQNKTYVFPLDPNQIANLLNGYKSFLCQGFKYDGNPTVYFYCKPSGNVLKSRVWENGRWQMKFFQASWKSASYNASGRIVAKAKLGQRRAFVNGCNLSSDQMNFDDYIPALIRSNVKEDEMARLYEDYSFDEIEVLELEAFDEPKKPTELGFAIPKNPNKPVEIEEKI